MLPMTLISLTVARPTALGLVPLTLRWTTVSTACSASTWAIAGRRRSTRLKT